MAGSGDRDPHNGKEKQIVTPRERMQQTQREGDCDPVRVDRYPEKKTGTQKGGGTGTWGGTETTEKGDRDPEKERDRDPER